MSFSNSKPLSSTTSIPTGSMQDLADFSFGDDLKKKKRKGSEDKCMSEETSPTAEATRTTFELFRTHDGEEYTVYMRDDGKRFYVDFEEQV